MTATAIQGAFLGNKARLASVQPRISPPPVRAPPPIQAKNAARPPATAFGGRPPGPPAPAFAGRPAAVQRQGGGGAFAVEAGALGLAAGGGRALPEALRGKMEAALGADFAAVRVHVGPQAERIGAIAFTLGSDIYFAPGRYRPETAAGQQLLGHELAHVVQQRAGRVRNPLGSGLAVVQDHALEAEADRLGRRAAAHRLGVQAKRATVAAQPETLSSGALVSRGRFPPIQRMSEGKDIVNDLTGKKWLPSYIDKQDESWQEKSKSDKKQALKGKKNITGKELRILLEGAVEAAWVTYAYHATQSKNVKSITEHGLDPQKGGTGAAKGDQKFEKDSKKRVHYTRDRYVADSYKQHLEGETPFGRKHEAPAPAEILQVVIPRAIAAGEEADLSSRPSDRAYRTKQKISGKYIRRTEPVPREPAWNDQAWQDHMKRALAEHGALLSNMPPKAKQVLEKVLGRGLDRETLLQLIKQGLRSLDTGDILDIQNPIHREVNPRILSGGMDPTGTFPPLRQ